MLADWQAIFAQNPSAAAAALGIVSLLAFYGTAWFFFGRDPPRGTVIPLFAPPDNLSPEAVRYLHIMGYDRKAFAAALVNAAVKGFVTIHEKNGHYSLGRTGKAAEACGLSRGEAAMGAALFAQRQKSLELEPYNSGIVQSAIDALEDSLLQESDRYFTANDGLFWSGIGIFALTCVAAVYFNPDPGGVIVDVIVVAIMIAIAFAFLQWCWQLWRKALRAPGTGRFVGAILGSLAAILFALMVLVLVNGLGMTISYAVFGLMLAGMAAIYLFRGWLKAPTRLGGATRDRIHGFKMYLETGEKDRLEALTPEVFEAFLPYAIALDCETSWSRQFEAQSVPDAPHHHYAPGWYVGTMAALGTAGFLSAVGSRLGSAAAEAAVAPTTHAPRSTLGSIGGSVVSGLLGGFSGGGRGGGGGGGW